MVAGAQPSGRSARRAGWLSFDGERELTYGDWNARAYRIAEGLSVTDFGPAHRVGVRFHLNLEWFVQQSMILVRRDTPGVHIKRGMYVLGYEHNDHGGHAELELRDVRVPATNLIGAEGEGFAVAQARLRPGRIHHCMRLIGTAERRSS